MKNFIIKIFVVVAILTTVTSSANVYVNMASVDNHVSCATEIVQGISKYSYTEMCEDINTLTATYPDIISSGSIGTTALGRTIPYVTLGTGSHNVMIQGSIHGREYLCTQVIMKMVEYYAVNKDSFSDVLSNTTFYIVPMANPDGVMIAQDGIVSISNQDTSNFVNSVGHTIEWKANAMGVDLNRNFDLGWEHLTPRATAPTYMDFKGTSAASEVETKALVSIASARTYDAFLSYHMRGNIIYYDEPGNSADNSTRATQLAQTISNLNGYGLKNLKSAINNDTVQQGGFNDWVQIKFNRPGVTVELGNTLPPKGQKSVGSIFDKNKDTWAAVARLYY